MKHRPIIRVILAISALMLAGCGGKKSESGANASAHTGTESSGYSGGKPLDPGFPPPMYSFTPKPSKAPNLVEAPKAAPVFLVPEGTELLSRGKKVTSSDPNPIVGLLKYITDGKKGASYNVELLEGPQWVQIDLEKSVVIHAIWIWHFHEDMRAYNDVIVRISDDPEFKTGVTTVFNNDYDDSSKLGKGSDNPYVDSHFGKVVDGKGTRGRYVRLHSNGNSTHDMNDYVEVEVYGKAS
jgi:hypothetical protein